MRPLTWVFLGAVLLASLYVGTLGTRFDFIDDGNLVYPTPASSLGERLQLGWAKVVENYEDLGPFRPVLWTHWEIEAELFGASAVRWRAGRLLWLMLAIAMFLWLLRELGVPRHAAWITAALAFWVPFRNEVWISLTLSEGVAMPYAFLALVCAVRGGRSSRPWPWDL
ncbi:MAG: hypothetical protein AB7K24_27945, partial [Gemmataceae bacterium]